MLSLLHKILTLNYWNLLFLLQTLVNKHYVHNTLVSWSFTYSEIMLENYENSGD